MPSTESRHLRSMTGQGHGEASDDTEKVSIEIRAVNHRGLKVIIRSNEYLSAHESQIEKAIRERMHRGSVTIQARLSVSDGNNAPPINREVLQSYLDILLDVQGTAVNAGHIDHATPQIDLTRLLNFPGVLDTNASISDDEAKAFQARRIQLVEQAIDRAMDCFDQMRFHDADTMRVALEADLQIIEQRSQVIADLSPLVVDRYRKRLTERIEKALAEHELTGEPVEVVREAQVFADRADISEELTRLASHLELFRNVLSEGSSDAVGRKLDFVIQEMFRETNTIGSKASDAAIAAEVVEIKCAIERMRELVQNLA